MNNKIFSENLFAHGPFALISSQASSSVVVF